MRLSFDSLEDSQSSLCGNGYKNQWRIEIEDEKSIKVRWKAILDSPKSFMYF